MKRDTWRESFRPLIATVIALYPGKPEREVRKALREASPFRNRKNDRRYWPYKVWCDEVNRQLGKKPPLGTRVHTPEAAQESNPNQLQIGGVG